MNRYIVAVDGPSAAGKSSVSKELSKRLHIEYIDTGAMYRAFAFFILKNDYSIEEAIEKFDYKTENDKIFLNGEDVTLKIRQNDISKLASDISKDRNVRDFMVTLQRKIAGEKSVILDGRDIGTNVFPNAKFKFYLDAKADTRAMRRYDQDKSKSYETLLEDIKKRDEQDIKRDYAPLKKAKDAIYIDTSDMSFNEVVEKMLEVILNEM